MGIRPTILLLIPHLGGGGAERVTAILTRGLPGKKYDIHLGLITSSFADLRGVPESVTVHCLGARRVRTSALALLRLVWRIRPDAILSGMAHLNFLVLLLMPLFPRKTRVLIRQNTTVSSVLQSGGLPRYTRLLYRLLYPRADRIVCQSQAMASDLAAESKVSNARLSVLPNPVDLDAIRACDSGGTIEWRGQGPHLLAVGRLSDEKGFDLLLRSLASLRLKYPDADLTIAGIGPEEESLRRLCRSLRLEGNVRFAGHVPFPDAWFRGATLFVLPSRYEGLPNALLEAAAGGLPIVALPASEGLVRLLKGKPGIWLGRSASSASLTDALVRALGSIRAGQRFVHSWIEPFHMENALGAYERLIDEALVEHK